MKDLSKASLIPGDGGRVAVRIELKEGWHTYWRNSGDSGAAPIFKWSGPPAVGEPQWPAPKLLRVGPLANYGYEGELVLPFPVEGRGLLRLDAEYLVCKEECYPQFAKLSIDLPAKGRALPPPLPRRELTASARGRAVVLGAPGDWFFGDEAVETAADQTPGPDSLRVPLTDAPPRTLTGVLVHGKDAWEVTAKVEPGVSAPELGAAVLLAFGGGLLLNLMPCVLPVLSIKVLGFLERKESGWAYAAGVVASFWALAGLLLALRSAGVDAGWGFQLQSPWLVAALAALFVAIGANLLGLFEVGLSLTRLGGKAGSPFWSGALAVIVATPCTAPFMGAALGAALTMPAAAALAVFTALGAGMALPYVLLAHAPWAMRLVPRPGAWMETFKQALSFPMFLTAAWLLGVLHPLAGKAAVAATALGLLYWRRAAIPFALALLVWVSGVLERKGLPWERYSDEALRKLQAQERVVFVDFTADWCVTCQVNKRTTLNDRGVERAFKEAGAVLLRADWTRRDAEITAALERFGRSGVPVYALYMPKRAPKLLPSILTPDIVIQALGGKP